MSADLTTVTEGVKNVQWNGQKVAAKKYISSAD
jgi:hypothetical protein